MLVLLVLFAAAQAQQNCSSWLIGNETFMHRHDVDFSNGATVADLGVPSSNQVERFPISGVFVPDNVKVDNKTLALTVDAYNGTGLLKCAQIVSNEQNIFYASVRTEMWSSSISGVGQSSFFYADDANEIDLTVPTSATQSNSNASTGLFYANAPHDFSLSPANATVGPPISPLNGYHSYRVDWLANATYFYFDNQLQASLTSNLPSQAGPWMWSAWANGDESTVGKPPTQRSVTRIRRITMYYNTTEDEQADAEGQACTVVDAVPSPLPSIAGSSNSGGNASNLTMGTNGTASGNNSTLSATGTIATSVTGNGTSPGANGNATSANPVGVIGVRNKATRAVDSNVASLILSAVLVLLLF